MRWGAAACPPQPSRRKESTAVEGRLAPFGKDSFQAGPRRVRRFCRDDRPRNGTFFFSLPDEGFTLSLREGPLLLFFREAAREIASEGEQTSIGGTQMPKARLT